MTDNTLPSMKKMTPIVSIDVHYQNTKHNNWSIDLLKKAMFRVHLHENLDKYWFLSFILFAAFKDIKGQGICQSIKQE